MLLKMSPVFVQEDVAETCCLDACKHIGKTLVGFLASPEVRTVLYLSLCATYPLYADLISTSRSKS